MILLQGPPLASQTGEYRGFLGDRDADDADYVPSEFEAEDLVSDSDSDSDEFE